MLNIFSPLTQVSVKRTFSSGSIILYQGEVPRTASILLSGVVRVYSISHQGDEQTVMFHVAGEFFPSPWIFDNSSNSLFFYEALTDCDISSMPRKEFLEFVFSDSNSMAVVLKYFASNYTASMLRINALEQQKASNKLAYTLYYLCQKYGNDKTNKVKIPITLTHQNIASLVGLTRETTTVEIGKLKRQGIISYSQQNYTINLDKLLINMGEESFRNIHIAD